MSGHSHYSTIKRQKAATDAVKGNVFSKHAKLIMIAAKGGADPDSNFRLRVAIDKARGDNMPKDNIERAISKATSEGGNLDEVSYEGFGPSGIAVIVEAATDNKNRTAQEIKNLFEKGGGRLGGPGAVSYNFENKGFMFVKKTGDPDSQMMTLIDLGVQDMEDTEDGIEVYVAPETLSDMRKKIMDAGFEVIETELQMKPKTPQTVTDVETAQKIIKFLDAFEEYDDVQKVFSNLDIPADVMSKLGN
ncbi:MAG: YebC/PmpR family DNA-binding transcriptional regulator [Microgenomates group bacterium]